jgi:LysM repeat protein
VYDDGAYIVQPGDTLWSIASSLTDGGIRDYVAELISLNGGASIDVGQRLVLPAD